MKHILFTVFTYLFFFLVHTNAVSAETKCLVAGENPSDSTSPVYECTDIIYTDWEITWDDGHLLGWGHNASCHGDPLTPPFRLFANAQTNAIALSKHQITSNNDNTGCNSHHDLEICQPITVGSDTGWTNYEGDIGCENPNYCMRRNQQLYYATIQNVVECREKTKPIGYSKRRGRYCPPGYEITQEEGEDAKEFCRKLIVDPCQKIGNPVTATSAMKVMTEYDYQSAVQDGLFFTRSYNLDGHYPYTGYYQGPPTVWFHNYGMQVFYSNNFPNKDTAYVIRPDGNRQYFWYDGFGFISTSDATSTLQVQKNVNGEITGWIYIGSNNVTETYDASGRLTEVKYLSGIVHHLSYKKGLLRQVSDSYGRTLEFVYNSDNLFKEVRVNNVLSFEYTYLDESLISSVVYPDQNKNPTDNPVKKYHYENQKHRLALTGITDELGNRYSQYEYHDSGRIARTLHYSEPGVEVNVYQYNDRRKPDNYKVTDPYGTEKTYAVGRTGSGVYKLKGVSKPCETCGNKRTYSYYTDGNLRYTADFKNVRTYYEYNDRNLETKRTEARNTDAERVTEIDWHPLYRLPTEVRLYDDSNTLVKTTFYNYDNSGRLLSQTETDPNTLESRSTNYTYCSAAGVNRGLCPIEGQLLSEDGPRTDVSDVTTYSYYKYTSANFTKGDLHRVVNALGHVIEYTSYDHNGRPLAIKDVNGVISQMSYNSRGWIESITIDGKTTSYSSDDYGQITRITQPDGSYISYEYDMAHRQTAIEDSLGNRIEYILNSAGDIVEQSIKDDAGVLNYKLSHQYNELARVTELMDGVGNPTNLEYDLNGNLILIKDANRNDTVQEYDALNRLIKTTDALDGVSNIAYDPLNQLDYVKDQRGLKTDYSFDALENLNTLNSPDTGINTYTYDDAGNRRSMTDASGITTTYTYDSLNRLIAMRYPDSSMDITYGYDTGINGKGRLTSINSSSETINYYYDVVGNIIQETHQFSNNLSYSIEYVYDVNGRLKSTTYPSGAVIHHDYNDNGQIASLRHNSDDLVNTIEYLPFGPVSNMRYANGINTSITFDLAYRQTELNHGSALSYNYAYDAVGNVSNINNEMNIFSHQSFEYDALNRLTKATGIYGHHEYMYDAVGNRISFNDAVNGMTESYNYATDSNRLTNWNGQPISYTTTGNVKTIGANVSYQYGQNNRLLSVSNNLGTGPEAKYNGLGEKSTISVNGVPDKHFIYDRDGQLIAEIKKNGEGLFELSREYVYLFGTVIAALADDIYYYHPGHLGTPLLMTNIRGDTIWSAEYTPFGGLFGETGTEENNHRFPGQYQDEATGLYYNYYRNYHPGLGRYIESDPIGLEGGLNTYTYAYNNPSNYIDPDGQFAFWGGLGSGFLELGNQFRKFGTNFKCYELLDIAVSAGAGFFSPSPFKTFKEIRKNSKDIKKINGRLVKAKKARYKKRLRYRRADRHKRIRKELYKQGGRGGAALHNTLNDFDFTGPDPCEDPNRCKRKPLFKKPLFENLFFDKPYLNPRLP